MDEHLSPEISAALFNGVETLRPLAGRDEFDPAVPAALVRAGLHLTPVPRSAGGLGAGLRAAVSVLAALGAEDGSAALGLAMHFHTLGSAVQSGLWPELLLHTLLSEVVDSGALINLAATEARGGSPARGALPDMTAIRTENGWTLNGEKHWTTWLPALRYAVVTARLLDTGTASQATESEIATYLLDLRAPGVERIPAFDALGMRASASGTLRLKNVPVPPDRLIASRKNGTPAADRPCALAWFGLCIAAVYLGVGEGARQTVTRWALARKPGDGSTPVADLPLIRARLGRLDVELRTARIVLQDVAARWDGAAPPERENLLADVALAKLKATQAAAYATDEALRIAGGPGFLCGNIERAFRDARAGLIHPPLEDLVYQDRARLLLARASPGNTGRPPPGSG